MTTERLEFIKNYTEQIGHATLPKDEILELIEAYEAQRWIPVAERLPDLVPCKAGTAYSEAVVVLTDDMTVCTAVWNGKHWLADFDYWEASANVTHWKWILPMPPKEKKC